MAPPPVDTRRYPRVNVEEGYAIRFEAAGRRFFGLPVLSLGGGGCCFRLSSLLAPVLKQDMVLHRVSIEHPDLPHLPQEARISWIASQPLHHEEPTVRVGIEYLDPDPAFLEAIHRCIEVLLKQEGYR